MEQKPQSNLYKLYLLRIIQQLQNKLQIVNNVQIFLENMLLNSSTTKYITPPFRDILQPPPITEMPHWNSMLLISLLIYLFSLTWKWNSNSMFQSSYFNIIKKTNSNLGMGIVTSDFLNFRFQFSCKPQCTYQGSLLVDAGVLFVFLATRWPCTNVLLIYSEINIASNDNSDGLEANETLHALAFFQKFYVCNFFKPVSNTNMHFTTYRKR